MTLPQHEGFRNAYAAFATIAGHTSAQALEQRRNFVEQELSASLAKLDLEQKPGKKVSTMGC